MRLAGRGSFDSLNPFILKGTPAAAVGGIYEPLMFRTNDEAESEYGLLAETIEYPKDRAWTIFKLRPQARWQTVNRSPPTTSSFVRHSEVQGCPARRLLAGRAESRANRRADTEIHLRQRHQQRAFGIIGQLTVLPKHRWATRDFEKTSLEIPPAAARIASSPRSRLPHRAQARRGPPGTRPVAQPRPQFRYHVRIITATKLSRSRPSRRARSTIARNTPRAIGQPVTTSLPSRRAPSNARR